MTTHGAGGPGRAGGVVVLRPAGHPARQVAWGLPWQFGTAAYWIESTRLAEGDGRLPRGPSRHRLGRDLREELAACLLGGHGMPFETGLAAFRALLEVGVLAPGAGAGDIERELRRPLSLPDGRTRRYRFPAQRARLLAEALRRVDAREAPDRPLAVRDWLLTFPGVGPKTAGWVVRNHFGSDDVAVLDVHVVRAAKTAGVFDPSWTAARDYARAEAVFVAWARAGGVPASDLDAVVWSEQAYAARVGAGRRNSGGAGERDHGHGKRDKVSP